MSKQDRTASPAVAALEPNAIRPGEVTVTLPAPDEAVYFIGNIRTPWTSLRDCPKRGDPEEGPVCRIEIEAHWGAAVADLGQQEWLQLLYWLHRARRDLVRQSPPADGRTWGTFSLRSPNRPNPIGVSVVRLVGLEGATLLVRGLDCLDGTPLIDIKPYFASTDCVPDAVVGWHAAEKAERME